VQTMNPEGENRIGNALSRVGAAAAQQAALGTVLPEVNVQGQRAPAAPPMDPALVAQAISSRTLRVEVTNPEAIRSSGGGAGGGSPLPGNVPRS
jgi:hypothetical protein